MMHACVVCSVALPVLQLLFNPLESADPKVAAALAKRKEDDGAGGGATRSEAAR